MTQGDNYVVDQDDEDQGQDMSDVQESITVIRAHRNSRKPGSLLT